MGLQLTAILCLGFLLTVLQPETLWPSTVNSASIQQDFLSTSFVLLHPTAPPPDSWVIHPKFNKEPFFLIFISFICGLSQNIRRPCRLK